MGAERGGEVGNGWRGIKVGGEWMGWQKASFYCKELAGTIGGLTNARGTVVSIIIFFIHVFISHALNLQECGAIDTLYNISGHLVCLSHCILR